MEVKGDGGELENAMKMEVKEVKIQMRIQVANQEMRVEPHPMSSSSGSGGLKFWSKFSSIPHSGSGQS